MKGKSNKAVSRKRWHRPVRGRMWCRRANICVPRRGYREDRLFRRKAKQCRNPARLEGGIRQFNVDPNPEMAVLGRRSHTL